jgi:hypothetical protein
MFCQCFFSLFFLPHFVILQILTNFSISLAKICCYAINLWTPATRLLTMFLI